MARRDGGIAGFFGLWDRHEALYISIFRESLEQLTITAEPQRNENAISKMLGLFLRDVCYKRSINSKVEVRLPQSENPIPPEYETEVTGKNDEKRPDFTCNICNPSAVSSEFYEIPFHVECKRIGETKKSYNLNKNYVKDGVCRFDNDTHKYGRYASSGMMIGYMISMKFDSIQKAVNNYMLKQNFSELSFKESKSIAFCAQRMTRKYVNPADFKLIHLWADLRSMK